MMIPPDLYHLQEALKYNQSATSLQTLGIAKTPAKNVRRGGVRRWAAVSCCVNDFAIRALDSEHRDAWSNEYRSTTGN